MPALSPVQSNTPTWFTEGDKNKGISWIGQDWLNILQAELLNILNEAGIKPDKGKLNQLTLSVKAIITANAYTQANNLKEIFDAGIAAQAAARGHLGLGKLATKDSLSPTDVNALAKDQNLADVPDKAAGRASLDVYSKTESNENYMAKSQNGADIPNKPLFIENVGLKETVERATNAVQKNGDEMTGSLTLRSDDRMHFVIANADGSVRAFIYKDKGGDGIRINNGADGGGEFVLNKDGGFYAPSSLHIGNAWIANDGNIFGTRWDSSGAWLWEAIVGQLNTRSTIDYVNQTFVRGVRAGYKETSQVWRGPGYSDQWPFVITGVYNPNQDDLVDNVDRRPLQHNINGVWYNIDFL
ncbi:phage tail protein [Salmonella enterica]|nr:phage tail protein [Salmonella enterica]EFS3161733.1 phage tail protein [Salmonella enterica]EGO4983085.1 phage tail protein [Salmonella enterica]EHO7889961.1 phage tail protein [Salmonella enterica]EHT1036060.1 phage tail protein [Salmonella enterica]